MTALQRMVRRVVRAQKGRDLVVILHPGAEPMVEVREKGRRKGYAITVAGLYTVLAVREADRAIAAKRAARAARRAERRSR